MNIKWLESCGSTNEELKKELLNLVPGAPLPPATAALEQTAGRGRFGRDFSSPAGAGLYISVPLQVKSPEDALCVMPMAAVCVCRAIEKMPGVKCGIKWPNDVLYKSRKLCGILTELLVNKGCLYLILGIGINLAQSAEDFPGNLRESAVSLYQITGETVSPQSMAKALLPEIEGMINALPDGKAEYLDFYRKRCVTACKEVNVFFSENSVPLSGKSLGISDDFGLIVQWKDGRLQTLKNGEVSVRDR